MLSAPVSNQRAVQQYSILPYLLEVPSDSKKPGFRTLYRVVRGGRGGFGPPPFRGDDLCPPTTASGMMWHETPAHFVPAIEPHAVYGKQAMAKKKKMSTRKPSGAPAEKGVTVSKQAVGGVTGAVLGAMVAGPLGALAGGFAGAVVGEQSARGRKPVKKTVEAIRSEIRGSKPMEALKSVADSAKSLVSSKLKKTTKAAATSTKPAAPKKKSKTSATKKVAKKSKAAKAPSKGAKTKKHAKKSR